MAKGKYARWLEPDGLLLLKSWARDGLTDEQIAAKCNIAVSTLYVWKNEHVELAEALKKGKEIVDVEVENSLLKKCHGYTVQLLKTFKVRKIEYGPNGRKISEKETLETGIDEVHIPADTTAQIFWLKNRRPDAWRDKRDRPEDSDMEDTAAIFEEVDREV